MITHLQLNCAGKVLMNRNVNNNTDSKKSVLSTIYGKAGVLAAILSAGLLLVTGCGNAIPDMSADVEQKVGEYAGVVMLRYDANHRSRLVELPPEEPVVEEPVEEEPEPEVQEEEPPVEEESSVTVIDNTTEAEPENLSPEEFLNLPEGMSLIYQGYSLENSYPSDDSTDSFFTLDASSGKKLIVLYYDLYNQSGADQSINFLGDGYAFKVKVNGNVTRTALVTMLMDDMSTYMGTIADGNGEQLVLIFEEDENVEISSLELIIKGNEGKCSVPLE